MLGIGEADLPYLSPRLIAWIDRPSADGMIDATSIRAAREAADSLTAIARRRREDPGDDLLTVVSRPGVDGRAVRGQLLMARRRV